MSNVSTGLYLSRGHHCQVAEDIRGGPAGHGHTIPGQEQASSRSGQVTEGWLQGTLQGLPHTTANARSRARAALQGAFRVSARPRTLYPPAFPEQA